MQWFAFTWAAIVLVLVLAGIGIPLARIIGLRGFAMVASAPAFAVSIIAVTAVVAPAVGLSWSLLPVALMTLIVGIAVFAIRRSTRRFALPLAPRRGFDRGMLVGLLAAVVLLSWQILGIFGSPENISQTFDNIFHLNGVRFALDTGNASSLWLGRMTNPGGALGFYPAAWHGMLAIVVQLSGASIPAAVNAATLVVAALVWPLGILLLTRTLFGRSRVLAISAGVLAASLPVFPVLLLEYGVLYPYQLGIALLPAVLAATIRALRLADGHEAPGSIGWTIAVIGGLPGVALSHPGAFLGWLALTLPAVLVFTVIRLRKATTLWGRLLVVAAFVAYLFIGRALIKVLRPPVEARLWPTEMGYLDAILDVVTGSAWYQVPAVLAAIAIVGGIVWAVISRTVPAFLSVGMYVISAGLYVTVAAMVTFPNLRDTLTGGWYNNIPRLAVLLPIAMVPLGAYGVACTCAWLARRPGVRKSLGTMPRWGIVTLGAVVAVLAVVGAQAPVISPVPAAVQRAAHVFEMGPESQLLSTDEAALLSRLDQHVPEGVAVAGSPWTGASLAFALADRPVLMPHTLMEITDELDTINDGLDKAKPGGAVCEAITDLGVGFVLDFPGPEVHLENHVFRGLNDLATADAVRLVDHEGDARLYEITACPR